MSHEHPIRDVDKRFIIDVNTRVVTIPETANPVLTQFDHNSEFITFEAERYVEGHDLLKCDKVEVHYNNISHAGKQTSRGVYEADDFQIDSTDSSKVIFTWKISEMATQYAGSLHFVVAFSCTNDGDLEYRWNTLINSGLTIQNGIYNGRAVAENYADVLAMWKQDLFGIGDTEEASMLLVSQQQQTAIEQKAAEVLKSMPDEYMDYSEFEKSKANVTDINRLFDSDWVKSKCENLYPYGDSSFTYDGTGLYTGVSAGGDFYLEEGRYVFIVTDTNAFSIYVMLGEDVQRLLSIKNDHIGIHYFDVTSEQAGQPLRVYYYASAATANTAGEYYLKRPYIFKKNDDGIFSDEFFVKTPCKLLESDVVRGQIGDNLYAGENIEFYYDGLQTYLGKQSLYFTLPAGDYTLTVLDSNAIFYIIYVGEASSSAKRLVATSDIPNGYKFTVPEEYADTPLLFFISASLETPTVAGDYYARSIYIFKDEGKSFLPDYFTRDIINNGVFTKISGPAFKAQNGCLSATADSLASGSTLRIDAMCNVKTNKSLVFTAKFDTFSGLRVGHGRSSYGGSYIEISTSGVDVYQYTTAASKSNTYSHGLTFSDFITVVINAGITTADITIFTAGGSYTASQVTWSGCNGDIFADSIGTAFTDCELKWTASSVKEKVWVFGDSYLGFNDRRWAGQMHNLGYKNWLASGYPGGGSSQELASLITLLTLGKPDIVVWCVGMNNGDSSAINSTWLSCVNEMLTLCADNNITPILATIPTCPEVDNTYKNEWVRNSGYRYVDFAKAVGVNGTSWYDGMLSGDNIHPSELGAKALASRVCVDVPEIMW